MPGESRLASGVVALAGRRVDATGSTEERFPLSQRAIVARELERRLRDPSVTRLVCSAAAGADLLALDVADRLGIAKHIVLPYDPSVFRRTSVIDRPGEWAEIYDRVLCHLSAADRLEVLDERGASTTAFLVVNQVLVERALHAARASGWNRSSMPTAIVVWEGRSRGEDDVTNDFWERATAAGFHLEEILTLPRATDHDATS